MSDWFLLFLEFKVGEKTLGRELFDNILQTTGIREKWYEIKKTNNIKVQGVPKMFLFKM